MKWDPSVAQVKTMRRVSRTTAFLIQADRNQSLLGRMGDGPRGPQRYGPSGYHHAEQGAAHGLAFNGQWLEQMPMSYLLGNGFRAYNPALAIFNCPDTLSPFGAGGINSYVYCLADPINLHDPSGHTPSPTLRKFLTQLTLGGADSRPHPLRRAKSLKNLESNNLAAELLQSAKDTVAKPITVIKKLEDFTGLSKDSYKFIYTDQRELLVAPANALKHSVIASHAQSTRIISAGKLQGVIHGPLRLSNHTGHYRANFDSLKHVNKHLRSIGVHLDLVKYK
jgi:RHS repeat-associated protein